MVVYFKGIRLITGTF